MARYTEHQRDLIDSTVERWVSCSLVEDEPLIFEAGNLWSIENLDELVRRFNGNPLEGEAGGGRFFTKLDEQLAGAAVDLRLLMTEVVFVHLLFSSAMTVAGKRKVLENALGDVQVDLPAGIDKVLSQGIGDPGIRFNLRRDLQVGYIIDFVYRLKQESVDSRLELLLTDPWLLRDFADDTDWPTSEMRHILLHLLRPDEFERISSGTHKREIAKAFKGFLAGTDAEDVDENLLSIRRVLEGYLPQGNTAPQKAVDFYHPPLVGIWGRGASDSTDGVGDMEALLWKKQLVLYGPPGTSKTWQASEIAEAVIRQAALKDWGPDRYFTHGAAVDAAVKRNVFRLQLHPGVGYEQFIRGLRLEDNVTRYRPGYLPWLVAQHRTQTHPEGLPSLPSVLILDEINRTNLSEMLGEAFSLLERDQRGREMPLPGFDSSQDPDVLVIPEDLYVIGTMNEIDQSVESLDFALRRRFLWRECPFDRSLLLEIVTARWSDDIASRFALDEAVTEQLQLFADRAAALNASIEESVELGRQYQIGHTYFADITFFIGTWVQSRKNRPAKGTYLWNSRRSPQPPIVDLWRRSLKPLLEQYLAGSDVREDELARLKRTFMST
ncbi:MULTISPECIES: AAA family ATPase [Nocardia]|uniref:ATPase dynein-related AAA domain-containing protein n=2 Tax=Nocardia TaxID=1817 RepID=A0A2T2YQA8_9NOCA|nr:MULTISPECIES: AAA family ATPase [Nocardia]PSR57695.1 hypothetical protein C8259_33585 [Nocardia nova]